MVSATIYHKKIDRYDGVTVNSKAADREEILIRFGQSDAKETEVVALKVGVIRRIDSVGRFERRFSALGEADMPTPDEVYSKGDSCRDFGMQDFAATFQYRQRTMRAIPAGKDRHCYVAWTVDDAGLIDELFLIRDGGSGADVLASGRAVILYDPFAEVGLVADMATVKSLDLSQAEVTDGDLVTLTKLPGLEDLNLARGDVTDRGLRHVATLRNLRRLNLAGTGITNGGLSALAMLPRLESLDLGDTCITDAGLRTLAEGPPLRTLILQGTGVGDTGIAHLGRCRTLTELDLGDTKVTDAGLIELGHLPSLENLNLAKCRVTDRGMAEVAKLERLRGLVLWSTEITDEGARHVATLKALRWLDISFTRITDAGVKEIAKLQALDGIDLPEHVTKASLWALAKVPSLRMVGLSGDMDDADVAEFERLRPDCVVRGTTKALVLPRD